MENNAERFYNESAEREIEMDASLSKPVDEKNEDNVSLASCVDSFTTVEKLGPEDPWYCSRCKEFQQATKKFDLWKLPPILVVHLKRFSYKNRYWREKLETFVDYPINEMDFSKFVQGPKDVPLVYDLYAVSNHFGSLGGGHYVAYAKNKNDKKWYKFDDSSVTKTEESRVKTSSAYVLFYMRRSSNPESPLTSPTPTPAAPAANANNSNEDKSSKQERARADHDADDIHPEPMEQDNTNSEMEDVRLSR